MTDGYVGRSPFPPIAEYAFLSDCAVHALVAPNGAAEWLCLPRPDSPSVFAALLDRSAGSFRLGPSDVMVPAGRRYLPGTLVLETTWQTPTGWLIVRDALCIGPWYHADICEHGVDERGVFCPHYDTTALDASLLLMPLLRFLPRDDEQVRATVLAIAGELTGDGLVLRYRVEETDDGLSGEEGPFAICSFWLASALAEIGELQPARQPCERLLSFAGPLELYAEEIDARSGRHLGNFPQAFTHLALINAVMHIIRADEEPGSTRRFAPPQPLAS